VGYVPIVIRQVDAESESEKAKGSAGSP